MSVKTLRPSTWTHSQDLGIRMCTSLAEGIILPAGNARRCRVPALPFFLWSLRLLPLPGTLSSAFACLCFVFQAWMSLLYGYFGTLRSSLLFSFYPLCNTYHNYYISMCLSMNLQWCWLPSGTASSVRAGTMFSSTATWYHSPRCSTWEWIHPWFIEDYMLTKISFKYKNTNLVLKVWLKPTP